MAPDGSTWLQMPPCQPKDTPRSRRSPRELRKQNEITPKAKVQKMALWGKKIKRFSVLFLIFYCIFWGFWIYIIPKWLIKVPGHFAILFG